MLRIVLDQKIDGPLNFHGFDPSDPTVASGTAADAPMPYVGPVAPSDGSETVAAADAPAPFEGPVTQAGGTGANGAISLNTAGTAATQNFDTLANTGTSAVLPTGWYLNEPGAAAAANGSYTAGTGSSTTGDTYSFGSASSTDRAFGFLSSGSISPVIGAQFTNNTGGSLGSLTIAYTGEEWRLGVAGRTDRLDFQISFDATSLSTGTWVDVDALDFTTPNTVGTGAKDGNAAGNFTNISTTYTLANALASGATFWIRFIDQTGASSDGLGIDNFSITPIAAAAATPGSLTIADVATAEGNSGNTDMVFTVTRAGGSTGAIQATYTITNGTTDASDFGTGFVSAGTVTFADGATTAQIHVPIAGDTIYEPNETFSVALSAPTGGATLGAHSTAIGTITNDDAAPAGTLSIGNVTVAEGDSGDTDAVFTVTRANGSVGAVSATYTITNGTTNASDFGAGFVTTGTVTFADGATTAQIHVPVHGDTTYEPTETFTVTLSAPQGGATLGTATGTGTITNDDPIPPAANVYINEIHYDNAGTDAGEAIEIAGVAGTDLSNYKLVFYNGSNTPGAAPTYMTTNLTGVIDDEGSGYGAVSFSYPPNGIQNGIADGVALIAPDGTVIQLLSYEGVFTAAAGTPAAGVTSTDIGVSEDGSGAVGTSLQLIGNGASYADFTWQPDSTSSFGSLNANQIIIADNATGQVRVADASVIEGNAGTSNLTFTVYRAGGLGSSATVDYTVALNGTATSDDIGPGAVLTGTVTFAVGAHSATVTVPVVGDTVGEANETLSLTLGNPTGNIAITDGSASGTIVNDDYVTVTISQIQGAGHISPYVGQPVQTTGIVTAVDTNGFYLQSAVGDGDAATSDAIFVFTSTAPTVVVGDGITVGGTVSEFAGDAQGLTMTEIDSPTITIDSHNNTLPAAILIGTGGILPPTQNLDDDHLTTYDPVHDGLDFWESLEGMRVTIDAPQAVSNTDSFGDTFVVASHGAGATGINDRGGITISPNADGTVDYNPELIQLIGDSGVFAGYNPNYSVGDQLSSVTGIVNYAFDNYNVIVTAPVSVTNDITLTRETTTLQGNSDYLSLATYNLENLDASDNKYTILASDIVYNLRAPDILAVQEVQDADGAGTGTDLSGVSNAQGIIDAIFALTGKHYGYIEIAPLTTNTSGGEPNGNIRNGYFYNIDRVSYVAGSAELITGAAYNGSRKPLVASWTFNSQTITTIDVHSTSRGGSEPLRGNDQPADAAGDAQRTAQSEAVKAYVNSHLADNPNLNIAVLGDWNGFYFENAQKTLTDPAQGGQLTNVNYLLAPQERYSYLFDGNAQQIDNILVSANLLAVATNYDAVHLNSQFGGSRPTDHDPQVVLFKLGNSGGDSFFGTSGNDSYTVDNINDHVYENANGGTDTILASISFDLANAPNVENLTLTGTADLEAYGNANDNILTGNSGDNFLSDGGGLDTLIGGAGNDNYVVNNSNDIIIENPGEGLDVVKAVVTFSIANLLNVEALRLAGSDNIDATGNINVNKIVGNSGDNVLDGGGGGDTLRGGLGNDTYIVRDANDRIVEDNTDANDVVKAAVSYTLTAGAFVETLRTIDAAATTAIDLTGNDHTLVIQGNAGANVLTGGAGNETISGFAGNDTLFGGGGNDIFAFAVGTGQDSVGDFVSGSDKLDLSAFFSDFTQVQAASHDVGGNAVIDLGNGDSVTLSGVLTAQLQSGDVIVSGGFAIAESNQTGALSSLKGASQFVFDQHQAGQDVVGAFVPGNQSLDLSAFFGQLSQVSAAANDAGGHAVLDLGDHVGGTLSTYLSAQLLSRDAIAAVDGGGMTGGHGDFVHVALHGMMNHDWIGDPVMLPMLSAATG